MSFTLGDYKWGVGERGITGGAVNWSFATTRGLGFVFTNEITDAVYRALIQDAFQAWEDVANIDFVQVVDGAQSNLRLGWDTIDGANGVIGEASTQSSKTTSTLFSIKEAEIRFDTAETWSTSKTPTNLAANFYTTALHEIGHAIGLLHSDDSNTIMYFSDSAAVHDLTACDILGAQTMYGAKTGPSNGYITGTWRDDVIAATVAADFIDGLEGIDTVRFGGNSNIYAVTDDNQLNIQVRDRVTGITDDLKNVERLQFDDGYLAFDTSGNAGSVYRLYQAAFDRTPDAEGLGFWIKHFDARTVDLVGMSGYFMGSAEFEIKYGAPENVNDAAFLTLLYNNILDRTPDQAGFDFWSGEQANGLSREAMLQYFSEGQETITKVAAAVDDGIWYV